MSTGLIIAAPLMLGMLVLWSWRMTVGFVAARPISRQLREAAGLDEREGSGDLAPSDFAILESLCMATGALSDARAIGPIRAYHRLARGIGLLVPSLGSWSRREMILCSRYLAARVDRQLTSNILCYHRAQSL